MFLTDSAKPRTGGERYLAERTKDAEYRAAHNAARRRIDQVDAVVRALDDRREKLGLTKAELARRADLAPEAVRRLFSVEAPNPTFVTLVALADALDLELTVAPRPNVRAISKNRTRTGQEPGPAGGMLDRAKGPGPAEVNPVDGRNDQRLGLRLYAERSNPG